jgi:hypothetical protein
LQSENAPRDAAVATSRQGRGSRILLLIIDVLGACVGANSIIEAPGKGDARPGTNVAFCGSSERDQLALLPDEAEHSSKSFL